MKKHSIACYYRLFPERRMLQSLSHGAYLPSPQICAIVSPSPSPTNTISAAFILRHEFTLINRMFAVQFDVQTGRDHQRHRTRQYSVLLRKILKHNIDLESSEYTKL